MKVKNTVNRTRRFVVKGMQMLTGKVAFRANEVEAGIYLVEQRKKEAHQYARGKRVALKLYLPKTLRFEPQKNKELKELVLWIDPEEFKTMLSVAYDLDIS